VSPIQIFLDGTSNDWWELVPAIVGGVIGALAAGIPAYLLAVRTSQEALEKERDERARNQHDRIFRTFLALSECLDDAVDHVRVIEGQISNNVFSMPQEFPISSAVQPIANLDFIGVFEVSSDDLLTFAEGEEIEYAQRIRHGLKKYNSIVDCLRKFTSLKEGFAIYVEQEPLLQIEPNGTIKGNVPTSVAQRVRMRRAQMENVIAPTRCYLREVTLELLGLAEAFGQKAKSCAPNGVRVVAFEEDQLLSLRDELSGLPQI
jgi:hypothetical protein